MARVILFLLPPPPSSLALGRREERRPEFLFLPNSRCPPPPARRMLIGCSKEEAHATQHGPPAERKEILDRPAPWHFRRARTPKFSCTVRPTVYSGSLPERPPPCPSHDGLVWPITSCRVQVLSGKCRLLSSPRERTRLFDAVAPSADRDFLVSAVLGVQPWRF